MPVLLCDRVIEQADLQFQAHYVVPAGLEDTAVDATVAVTLALHEMFSSLNKRSSKRLGLMLFEELWPNGGHGSFFRGRQHTAWPEIDAELERLLIQRITDRGENYAKEVRFREKMAAKSRAHPSQHRLAFTEPI